MSQSHSFQPISKKNLSKIRADEYLLIRFQAPDDEEYYLDYLADHKPKNLMDKARDLLGIKVPIPNLKLTELEQRVVHCEATMCTLNQALFNNFVCLDKISIFGVEGAVFSIEIGWLAPGLMTPDAVKLVYARLKDVGVDDLLGHISTDKIAGTGLYREWMTEEHYKSEQKALIRDFEKYKKMLQACAENDYGYVVYCI